MSTLDKSNAEVLEPHEKSAVKSNFYYSFSFLPKDERQAMRSIYDFCRYTDDLVDTEIEDTRKDQQISRKQARLNWWRKEVEKCYSGTSRHPILVSLHWVIKRFKIPKQYLLELIDGVEMDLKRDRYDTFADLYEYCYKVASVVGLISIEIFGYKYEETKQYAVDLGIALQLTNILRDVKKDTAMGRIYLPQADMIRFGVTEQDIIDGNYNVAFIQLMKFETDRARKYFESARQHLNPNERFTLFASRIMDAIYFRLLRKIELAEYNIFARRINVSTPHKILIAFRYWVSSILRLRS